MPVQMEPLGEGISRHSLRWNAIHKPRLRHMATNFSLLITTFLFLVAGGTAATAAWAQQYNAHAAAPSNTAVLTYKKDNTRTGQNVNETTLNTSNVTSSKFGKRVAYPVNGAVYAEPLYDPGVTIGGAIHNVVFVATQHDSIYAFDADQTTTTAPLWQTSFINTAKNIKTVSSADVTCNDITPEMGITGTPTIDPATGTLYVVVNTNENGTIIYRLHALDITTGKDVAGSPVTISATLPGTGAGSVGGNITFDPRIQLQRGGLLLLNNRIYIDFGSHCDHGNYHGWILQYNASTLHQTAAYISTPNGKQAGIWQAGEGIATDGTSIYVGTGNGTFNLSTGGHDAGDTIVKLNTALQRTDYFTPFNQQCMNQGDGDLGSGGALLLPNQGGSTPNELILTGKEGRIYVTNRDNMGQYNTIANPCNNLTRTNVDKIVQELPRGISAGVWGTPAYWQGSAGQYVFLSGNGKHMQAFKLTNGKLSTAPTSQSTLTFSKASGNPVVSSNGNTAGTGILWTVAQDAALHAYDATNLTKELYNSNQQSARDSLGSYVKFEVPTVANGQVFVGTQNSLVIFGLLSGGTTPPGTYNNVGTSDDSNVTAGNFDAAGNSYSAQALQAASITPGATVTFGGVAFTWPTSLSGSANNYQASGQTIPVTPVNGATTLAFLGSATSGPATGTATAHFSDGSTQTFPLGFSDWTLNGGTATPSYGNQVVATTTYRNTPKGSQTRATNVFFASVTLQTTSTLTSVTLPPSVNQGLLHVFAIGTK